MPRPPRRVLAFVVIAMTSLVWPLRATPPSTDTYPAPRWPRYLVNPSPDRMLQAARIAVRQPYGMSPLGKMQSGQKVYVFLEYTQHPLVWDAIRQAWAERGVEAVAIQGWEQFGMTKAQFETRAKANLLFGSDGWKEWGVFEPKYRKYFPPDIDKSFGEPLSFFVQLDVVKKYLDQHPEIRFLFHGPGGGKQFFARAVGPTHADKWVGNWLYENATDLLSKTATFPGDIWSLLDDEVVKPIPHVSEGTIVDPQGTRLHFTLTPEQMRQWTQGAGTSNHVNIYPPVTHATWKEGTIVANGNHTGFFPTMTVRLNEHGRVMTVDGGGKFGDLFRQILENPRFKNAKFPTSSEPGYWYLTQDGFATNPKFVRNLEMLTKGTQEFANLPERQRAGVQHFSFSQPAGMFNPDPKDVEYAKKIDVPLEHTAHLHIYFATVKWRLADTGEWITLSDKGYLQALSSPEVRALAAKYGDPDLTFRYEWIPEIPGINAPGDLQRDYGSDPWKWIQAEWGRIQAGTYGHYVEDYQTGGMPTVQ